MINLIDNFYDRMEPPGQKLRARASDRYVVIEPKKMMERLRLGIDDCLYKVGETRLSTTSDGMEAVGAAEILRHDLEVPRGMRLWFGFTISNNFKRGSRLYCGVTDEQAVVLDRSSLLPHRGGMYRLGMWIEETMTDFMVAAANYRSRIYAMKNRVLPAGVGDRAVMAAARKPKCYIAWSRMGKLDALRQDRETKWGLLQAFGAAAGLAPPISSMPTNDQLRSMYGFYRILEAEDEGSRGL